MVRIFTSTGRVLKRFVAVALCACASLPAVAQHAAESDITLVKGEAVRISNIDDWLIGVFDDDDVASGLIYNWDWECVYTSTGRYSFEVNSLNGGARLHLLNGAGDVLNYRLFAYYRRGGTYRMQGTDDTTFAVGNLRGSRQLDCNDEPSNTNLWFAAVVYPTDFNAAPAGIYRDYVTIMVAPE